MSCKTETTFINQWVDGEILNNIQQPGEEKDVEYSCTQYSAKVSAIFKLRVMKVFGSSIKHIIAALPTGTKKVSAQKQIDAIVNAVNALFDSASPDEVIDLIWEMLSTDSTCREGQRLNGALLDQYFSGDNLGSIYKLFIFVLRVNYAGFFKGQRAQEALAVAEKHL